MAVIGMLGALTSMAATASATTPAAPQAATAPHAATPATAPASGVRGDWFGTGRPGLIAATKLGQLVIYPTLSSGRLGRAVPVGIGWSSSTWLGSPGDVNGDRRADLLQRRTDGTLWLYTGRGAGAFAAGTRIGSGWAGFTALTTPLDVTGDAKPDLLARKSDGTMHLYAFTGSAGTLRYVRQVGTGWNDMRNVVGVRDTNGDGLGDVYALDSASDCMYLYHGTAAGLRSSRVLGCGWGGCRANPPTLCAGFDLAVIPGDVNGDRHDDLYLRSPYYDGDLFIHFGKQGGSFHSRDPYFPQNVGSHWNTILAMA